MSSKAIVLKRNSNDDAKYKALLALAPRLMVEYSGVSQLAGMTSDFGKLDYLLVTGGHGDFRSGRPSKFNDADIASAKTWIARMKGSFQAIILDTCFSSALAGAFLPFLPNGGCLVCAHGSGEGWAEGFNTGNGTRTLGSVLADVVDNMHGLTGGFASISLAIKKPLNQLLYSGNAGAGRGKGLSGRRSMDMDVDSEAELREVDLYLARDGIGIVETSAADLMKLLNQNLTMKVV